eukprot:5930321-Amphidinium_carterae.1
MQWEKHCKGHQGSAPDMSAAPEAMPPTRQPCAELDCIATTVYPQPGYIAISACHCGCCAAPPAQSSSMQEGSTP